MKVPHRDLRGRHRRRGAELGRVRRALTLAASLTLLSGVATALAPAASAEVATTGTITGTVTVPDGSDPAQVCALAYPATSMYPYNNGTVAGSCAAGSGAYAITDLPFGQYVLRFIDRLPTDDSAPNHDISQWWDGGSDYYSATPIALGVGSSTATADVEMVKGGWITTTTAEDDPQGGYFSVYPAASGGTEKYIRTDVGQVASPDYPDDTRWYVTDTSLSSAGSDATLISSGLSNGDYYLVDQWGTVSDQVTVTKGAVTNVEVASPQLFNVSGEVNDSEGIDSNQVRVDIYRAEDQSFVASAFTQSVDVARSSSGYSNWSIDVPSGTYNIKFSPQSGSGGFLPGWLASQGSHDGTTNGTVSADARDAASVSVGADEADGAGVDIGHVALDKGASATGTVTDTNGNPLENMLVSLCRTDQIDFYQCIPGIDTNSQGEYSASGLIAGTYDVQVDPIDAPGSKLIPENIHDVAIAADDTMTLDPIKLKSGVQISGTITDRTTGVPLAGISIWPSPIWDDTIPVEFAFGTQRDSDAHGLYATQGLNPGTYLLAIGNSDGRYQCGWWSETAGTVANSADATPIPVGDEDITEDIALSLRNVSTCDSHGSSDGDDGSTGNGGDTGAGDNGGDTGNSGGSNPGTPTTPTTPVMSEPVTSTVKAGGAASSSSSTKPTATTPVIASVTSPVAGNVSFTAVAGPVAPPKNDAGAYTMLGRSFVIEAPTTTPDKPLALDFTIGNSIMPNGLVASDVIVFRDGVAVPDCKVPNATKADPDPCIVGRSSVNDVKSIRVLSSHASTWTFGVAKTDRVAGSNRYATAAALATQFGTAKAIVVANGIDAKDGADAMAANYLAGRVNAPIVLAQANRVETATLTAVKAVLKGAANPTIYVMGGSDSISDAVAGQIKTVAGSVATGTVTVKRIGGADRYATAALAATTPGAVANSLKLSASGAAATTAILASGTVNADALAAEKITQLIVLGGTDRISQAVLDQTAAVGVTSTKRIAGANRFDTSAQLYTFAMGTLIDGSGNHYGTVGGTVYLANGVTGFPDALAVGPLAGKNGGALLTVSPNKLGTAAATFIKAHGDTLDSVTGLGSATTISAAVLAQATGLL